MNKVFFTVVLLTLGSLQKGLAQDSTSRYPLSNILYSYYNVKNALVAGDASSAASSALSLVNTVMSIHYKIISEGNTRILANHARKIAESKDLSQQRESFTLLSADMAALAKAVKLTNEPVYQLYCPMKKAIWLSSEKAIKNPYYGNSMLTCGAVTATLP